MTQKMSPNRRFVLRATASFPLVVAGVSGKLASAQEVYPSRPVTMVVGFSAGGSSDLLGRKMAVHLGNALGQSVVVQNKDGAGSTIAVRLVADSKPDGYTLLLGGTSGMVIAPLVMKLSYDSVADFKTVGMIGRAMCAIAVHPSVPAKTLPELVALLKANPGKYSFASAGMGGFDHLTGELFKQVGGDLNLVHVPYKGGPQAVQSVIAGQTELIITTLAPMYPFVKSGQLRIITVTGPVRSQATPELPTAVEQGFPGLVVETVNFLTVPSKTPPAVIAKLKSAMATVMANPAITSELHAMGFEPILDATPQATDAFVKTEMEKWRKIAVKAKVTSI